MIPIGGIFSTPENVHFPSRNPYGADAQFAAKQTPPHHYVPHEREVRCGREPPDGARFAALGPSENLPLCGRNPGVRPIGHCVDEISFCETLGSVFDEIRQEMDMFSPVSLPLSWKWLK